MKKYVRLMLIVLLAVTFAVAPAFSETEAAGKVPALSVKKLQMTKGDKQMLAVTGKRIVSKKYTSTNAKVATVSKKGKITAKKAGTCKIKVVVSYKKTKNAKKFSKVTLKCNVKVVKKLNAFQSDSADFAIDIAKASMGDSLKENENALISPVSIMSAMSLILNGADSNTKSEIMKAMCGTESLTTFNKNMAAYEKSLTNSSKVKFNLANSIWYKDTTDITVSDDYIDNMQKMFNASVYKEPFDDTTLSKVNEWVDTNTDHMIPSILDQLDEDTMMILVNALSFDAKWMTSYSDSQVSEKQNFTNSDGSKSKVTMLTSKEHTYIENDNAKGFMKYYEGGDYAFVAILPKNNVSTQKYLSQLDGEEFMELMQSAESQTVDTKTPEFTYDYDTSLVKAMKELGVKDLFDENKADLSQMVQSTDVSKNLYLSDLIHKTHIELNQDGTKAAAVTAGLVSLTSAPRPDTNIKKVYLNKPFVYAIVDTKTNIPVFIGAVNKL